MESVKNMKISSTGLYVQFKVQLNGDYLAKIDFMEHLNWVSKFESNVILNP